MAEKPGIPKGTRDFSPAEVNRRNYIFDTIKDIFKKYGYQPIETPAMENLSTLMGKYGEEGDRLLFKILNSGDFLAKIPPDELKSGSSSRLTSQLCEKGLRYDLTVPFARYVVQYNNDITFPFKRYQVQPVWRGDNPQKGRYREFYQCDADVVGSPSLLNEVELIQIVDEVFSKLDIKVIIKINNRKILSGIAAFIGEPEKITDITVAIDKLEKTGFEAVNQELLDKGLKNESVAKLQPLLRQKGSSDERLASLKNLLKDISVGLTGINETETIFDYLKQLKLKTAVEFDITLARGLNYYTGAIIEVKAAEMQIGSISGGGRYDDLTGIFGMPGISGVGISFGADRIYDVLNQLNLFPPDTISSTKAMIVNFGGSEERYAVGLAVMLRKSGISTELYPDNAKIKKQFAYADKKKIEWVVIAGGNEIKQGIVSMKNMITGAQEEIKEQDLIIRLTDKTF